MRQPRSILPRLLSISLLFILIFLSYPPCGHALTADELLIVANSAVPESVDLARYYMKKRNVPAGNLLLVKTSDKEQIGRQDYDQQIARPVREFLEKKDPDEKRITCIVLFYGMPLRVLPPPPATTDSLRLKELQAILKDVTEREKLAGKEHKGISKIEDKWTDLKKDIRRLARTDWAASVDSELALIMEKTYDLEGWLPNRYFVDFHGKEIKNMPRQVLLVSRVDGPTPAIVRRIIDDSIHAETEGLSGRAYFDARWPEKSLPAKKDAKPSAYELYDLAIHKAARIVRESKKLPVVLDDRPELFGPGEAPDAALYCGWYSLGKYVDAFTWVRGAVGYHVASSECTTLKASGSTVWCKAMLDKGIAATVGPVAEPYLQSFPAPGVFFSCLLDGRLTLAECYSLANPFLSWQQVLIGDPLYRPFKKR